VSFIVSLEIEFSFSAELTVSADQPNGLALESSVYQQSGSY
jgi:hypothetical protein